MNDEAADGKLFPVAAPVRNRLIIFSAKWLVYLFMLARRMDDGATCGETGEKIKGGRDMRSPSSQRAKFVIKPFAYSSEALIINSYSVLLSRP